MTSVSRSALLAKTAKWGGGVRVALGHWRDLTSAGYALGLALFAAALLLRFSLNPLLPPGYPFLTFFPAVVLTALLSGLRPGLLVAGLSGLAGWYYFMPRESGVDSPTLLTLVLYSTVMAVNLAVIHAMRSALARLRLERQRLRAEQAVTRRLLKERAKVSADIHASRERLNTIISQASVGITLTSPTGEFLLVNDCFCEIVGRSREDILGRYMREFTHPDDLAENLRLRARLLDTGEPFTIQKRYIRPDGSLVWVQIEVALTRDVQGHPEALVGVVMDISAQREAEENRRLLLNELNHRVKNTLATVQSIAMQTRRTAATPEAFFDAFTSRLLALSRGHDLLTREAWAGASLEDVVRQTLVPFAEEQGKDEQRVHIEGPHVRLPPRAAVALNMGFHELATNAAKYGALSREGGRIEVTWTCDPSRDPPEVELTWAERGGPPVRPPGQRGFGSRLIESGIARELDGDVRLDFEPEGVRCTMNLPLHPHYVVNI